MRQMMRKTTGRMTGRAAAAVMALGLVAMTVALVGAHERRDIGDGQSQYRLVVGFLEEPAITGEQNGLSLRVSRIAGGAGTPAASPANAGTPAAAELIPVEGLQDTLQAEVIYGDQRMDLALNITFGEPGLYGSIFFPMAAGDYSFRIFGTIEGLPIDETFTSGLDTFSPVVPVEPLQFPKPATPVALTIGAGSGSVSRDGSGVGFRLDGFGVALLAAVAVAGAGWMAGQRRSSVTNR